MKRIILCLCLFIFIRTQGQQINPVPDYVFSNRMSVGRNSVTDTAAYFSIGPRYNAIRGMMPPMVTDTANVAATKRNGLLIFSIQKNKYLYWDSVGSKWAEMAGTSGTALTSADTANLLSTKAWRKKGTDSLGGIISTKVNFSDTSTMLSPYLRKSDTSNMLSPYYRSATATSALAAKVNVSDTANMLSPYLRIAGYGVTKSSQTISADTAAMATRARVKKQIDSIAGLSSGGSVTSVSAGTGMSFTTITTTGSVSADTTVLSTRAWRRKGLDSLAALELSLSDTATMLSPYVRAAGFGVTKSGQSLLADSAAMATRARVQKAVDSLNLLINAKGLGTVTSVATGVGLSGGTITSTGTIIADTLTLSTRAWRQKGIDSVRALIQSSVTGSGTTNYIPKFTSSTAIGNSVAFDNGGTELLVNTTSDGGAYALQVSGNSLVTSGKLDIISNTSFGFGLIRTGTSSNAAQIYNNGGIAYFGAESSTGGAIFVGSSAYAVVYGNGANYPLQFATNNTVRATITSGGNLLVNTTSDVASNYKLQVNGDMYSSGLIYASGSAAQVFVGSTSNKESIVANSQSITGTNNQAAINVSATWNTTGSPSLIDLYIVNTASGANSNYIQAQDSNGGNIFRVTKDAGLITGIPSGGSSSKWKLGEVATVSPTSPNRTIRVEIDGTVYYLHAKTTNN